MNESYGCLTPKQVQEIERDVRTFHGPGDWQKVVAKRIADRLDGELDAEGVVLVVTEVRFMPSPENPGSWTWQVDAKCATPEAGAQPAGWGTVLFEAPEHPVVDGEIKTAEAAYAEMYKRAIAAGGMHRPVPLR